MITNIVVLFLAGLALFLTPHSSYAVPLIK